MFLSSNIHVIDLNKIKSGLIKQMIESWCKINFYSPKRKENILEQSVCYNSHIRKANVIFQPYGNEYLRRLRIKDLFDANNKSWDAYDHFIKEILLQCNFKPVLPMTFPYKEINLTVDLNTSIKG